MKLRFGFVTNSSSTIYIITNKTDSAKTLLDFVTENPQLLKDFENAYYEIEDGAVDPSMALSPEVRMKECARCRGDKWAPHEKKTISFGDEDGDLLGKVYDYILREGGESKSFKWKFDEYNR